MLCKIAWAVPKFVLGKWMDLLLGTEESFVYVSRTAPASEDR